MQETNHYDVVVIGAGAAGLSAGIYLSRARMRTLIINEGTPGGQMILTHEIANYPGVESISGYQLSQIMKKQAMSFGCEIINHVAVKSFTLEGDVKTLHLEDGRTFTASSVIVAPGGRSRMLHVPGEEEFKGKGVSYCATCDGDFFTDKEIIVVGGGNSALEEAVSLTKYASKVTIVHQFDHFQAFEHAIAEAQNHPKINFLMESAITAFYGTDMLDSVDIKNLKTNEVKHINTDGVFIFIGYVPQTAFLKETLDLNKYGEIIVTPDMQTSLKGVFAAGDAIVKKYRQVSTAVADGTIAALSAAHYVNDIKKTLNIS